MKTKICRPALWTAAFLAAALVALVPDLAMAGPVDMFMPSMSDEFTYANLALVALRERLGSLQERAQEIEGEVRDDMDDDQIRAMDEEHETLLRNIEETQAEIDRIEAEGDGGDAETRGDPASGDDFVLTAAGAADISNIGRRAGMDATVIEEAIRSNTPVEDFRRRAFEHMAAQDRRTQTEPGRVLRDEAETRRDGMVAAMSRHMGGPELEGQAAEIARPFMRHADVVDFAADCIGHCGAIRTVAQREEVLQRAFHSTSDFPAIFGSAINTSLERRYGHREPTYRRISRRRDFMDFRPHYAVGVGEFPMLEKLTEAGEIKFGTFGESKEMIAVVAYAKGIRLTRQMLVNDRLGALGEIMGGYGRTVSRFEEITFYTMMLSASTKLSDNKVVFHAGHDNLAASGSAITVASMSAAKAAMRKQKGIDGDTLDLTPSILLVSPDKETEALQYLAPITANDSVKVNPHVGTLDPMVSAQLEGNAWYLFADPDEAAVYQWGLLDGYQAPRVRFDEPFGTQGVGMTVEHDFGVGAIDYRGGYKNPGNA